jgi:Recombination endonuclease VII
VPRTDEERIAANRAYKKAWTDARPDYYKKRRERLGDRIRAQKRASYKRVKAQDPDAARRRNRTQTLAKYNITIEQWEVLFDAQGRVCRCCGTDDPQNSNGRGWCTDHDHETDTLRGIVCKPCNTILGMLGDASDAIRARTSLFLDYLDLPCPLTSNT